MNFQFQSLSAQLISSLLAHSVIIIPAWIDFVFLSSIFHFQRGSDLRFEVKMVSNYSVVRNFDIRFTIMLDSVISK